MSDDEFEEKKVKQQGKTKTILKKDKYGALVLVIDCGRSMQEMCDGRSHFSMAKEAADWILSRKIFTQAKDRCSIILFGCEETKNHLDINGVFQQDEVLSKISFDHLRFLNHEVNYNLKNVGNAVDALVVATDFLHNQTDGDAAVETKSILVFTNGLADCGDRDSEVSAVVNGINALEATLVAVGISEDSIESRSSQKQIMDIIKKTDGSSYSFELVA
ncbi:Ku70/Ku80 alpha/beta domain protein [Necator americanus]|uniref:Ku70/Ku80 alpha/beta domain protein n=1 Tax=Necator americanus TaxID=51031 RepID=W2TVM6_NECAM|nr:Ku70/Ku80 alpha/beta domain protein [Necator americanus]ETN85848.1 Ku70/Ku80 alpha/beta domain protein [Necator americanus]